MVRSLSKNFQKICLGLFCCWAFGMFACAGGGQGASLAGSEGIATPVGGVVNAASGGGSLDTQLPAPDFDPDGVTFCCYVRDESQSVPGNGEVTTRMEGHLEQPPAWGRWGAGRWVMLQDARSKACGLGKVQDDGSFSISFSHGENPQFFVYLNIEVPDGVFSLDAQGNRIPYQSFASQAPQGETAALDDCSSIRHFFGVLWEKDLYLRLYPQNPQVAADASENNVNVSFDRLAIPSSQLTRLHLEKEEKNSPNVFQFKDFDNNPTLNPRIPRTIPLEDSIDSTMGN